MPAAKWMREVTDEDFIPLHRIKYFKRTSDGEIMWDRDFRIDKVFGSGLSGVVNEDTGEKETLSKPKDEVAPTLVEG